MMEFTEKMLERVALETNGSTTASVNGKEISFKAPFKRIAILDAIQEHTGFDVSQSTEAELRDICRKLGIETNEAMGKGKLIDEIFGEKCEHHYIQPTFITDYPVEMSPLCKRHRENPELTERFELMINGKELANAYTELNDPIDQRRRFEEQMNLSERGDDEAMFIDQDFLRSLEFGMPPTSGMGIGIDRLVMLLTGNTTIQEVLFFPQMRPEKIRKGISASDFIQMGVSETWAAHLVPAGFASIEMLMDEKANIIQQKLNGYRKKNKLDIPAVQLDEVESWQKPKTE
jgi:lysyl-tRNA synthetase class 2